MTSIEKAGYPFPNSRFLFSIYPSRGGVAQLGERLVRNQKAVSSILITSTTLLCSDFRLP